MSCCRLRDAKTQPERDVVVHRHVADQLRADGAQTIQPRTLTDIPGITDVAEYRERELVGADRQVPDHVSEQCERHAILRRERRGSAAYRMPLALLGHVIG